MKKLKIIKFYPTIVVLILLLAFSSCKKDDPEKLTLTGTWEKTITVTDTYNGTMTLVQNDNDALTGSFVFSDNTGYTPLLSTSKIIGNSVIIEWMLSDTYKLSFAGTVSSDFNSMSGNITANGIIKAGTWSATRKLQQKSASINGNNPGISEKKRLLKLLSR